jgi:hypothetical protein
VQDLLQLAVDAHGGLRRWEQISRFRAVGSITGAVWDLKGGAQPRRLPGPRLDLDRCRPLRPRLQLTAEQAGIARPDGIPDGLFWD